MPPLRTEAFVSRLLVVVALPCAAAGAEPLRPAAIHDGIVDGARADSRADDGVEDVAVTEPPAPPSGFAPTATLFLPAIDLYRERIGPHSVARCPFVVSCSTYARDAIARRGFVGFLSFLDRFLFRENIDAFHHYDWAVAPDGAIRLDDGAPWLDAHRPRPLGGDDRSPSGARR